MADLKKMIRENPVYKGYKDIMTKLVARFPINHKKVIFDNFGGRGYGDDPKYIAEELRKKYPELKLIWVTSDMSIQLPDGIQKVKYGTVRAAYHWATSKVWVDNIKSSLKVKKKPQQYYIQTWHSTLGFKKNEQDAKTLTEKYKRQAIDDASRTDLMYSDNDFRLDKYKNRYWYSGEVIKCDVPRMSIMLNPQQDIKKKVRQTFGIGQEKRIVLYAPTFRKTSDLNTYLFDYDLCMKTLEERFGGDFIMLIRLHPNEARYKNMLHVYDGKKVFCASDYPDMQELLAVADVLITDYSGCMFDFGFTGKPVFLFAKDLTWYLSEDRDVYFSLDELPFSLATNEEELFKHINNFDIETYSDLNCKFKEQIGFEDHGNGAAYIADIIANKSLKK